MIDLLLKTLSCFPNDYRCESIGKAVPRKRQKAPLGGKDSSYINYDQFEEISQNSITMQRNLHIPTKLFKFTQLKKHVKMQTAQSTACD